MKKKTQTLSIVVIPGVNRAVVRFKLPVLVLYIVPILVVSLICCSAVFYSLHSKSTMTAEHLLSELTDANEHHAKLTAEKEETIDYLQNEVVFLSQQAQSIQQKMNQLKQLENDLNEMTSAGMIESTDRTVSIASPPGITSPPPLNISAGIGGKMIPVTQDDIDQLTVATKLDFLTLDSQLGTLFDRLIEAKEHVMEYQYQLGITPTLWPSDSLRITSDYGYRKDPFTRRLVFHDGIDIGGDYGDSVYATAGGTVLFTGYDSARGNNIIIDHTQGIQTMYMHLKKIGVEKGDSVAKGQQIGQVGSTGRSTGPHIHYTVKVDGKLVNPTPYLQEMREEEQ